MTRQGARARFQSRPRGSALRVPKDVRKVWPVPAARRRALTFRSEAAEARLACVEPEEGRPGERFWGPHGRRRTGRGLPAFRRQKPIDQTPVAFPKTHRGFLILPWQ